jgi:catechol 2,3-dioxygenase-like lactoylglutathione lyase family enzyme
MEHAAIYVRDIDWYIKYFRDVFGMEIIEKEERDGELKQVWLHGGVQLAVSPGFEIGDPQTQGVPHIGIMTENVELAIEASRERGARPVEGKENWVWLPDGVALEIKLAKGTAVAEVLAIHPR